MTKIILNIDAASFRQHAEEQEGTGEDVAKTLWKEVETALECIDWLGLADAILKGYDRCITMDVSDAYQNLSEDDG